MIENIKKKNLIFLVSCNVLSATVHEILKVEVFTIVNSRMLRSHCTLNSLEKSVCL